MSALTAFGKGLKILTLSGSEFLDESYLLDYASNSDQIIAGPVLFPPGLTKNY